MRDFGNAHAYLSVHFVGVDSPRVSKFLPHFGIGDILIAREHVRQHAHITRTLHVVLTANRADANGRTTEIPGQQRQAGKPFYHIHRLSKLRHAHAPHHRG
ncbi:hypothetical protein D3C80_1089050 [compost metagenome]